MKSLQTIGRLAVALALFALPGPANASTSGSIYVSDSEVALGFEYFEDDLAPYGQWIDYAPYGECWVPAHAPRGWRPYCDGYWTYTDCGWSWVSNEPWGWATYHYGRWFNDPHYGWMWVPGNVWAPSWVAWHCGDGYIGWAPLPPAAQWNVSVGLHFNGRDRIPARDWCFVEQRHFAHSQVKSKIVNVSRNDSIYRRTRDVTRFESWNGRPKNVGIDVDAVNDWGGGKVKHLRAVDAAPSRKGRAERVRGNAVEYYRPRIAEPARREGARRVEAHRPTPTKGNAAHRSENRRSAPSKSHGKSAKQRGR